jgi:hypothetical protein
MRSKRAWLLVGTLMYITLSVVAKESATNGDDVFTDRILPIFRSKDPSSCTECHLAAVELKDYIRPTARETFLSLRDQGLIDLEKPAESRILELIRMAPKKAAPLPSRRRAEELAAFEAWILKAAQDPKLRDAPPLEKKLARPKRPNAVIRHARKSRVLSAFTELVWADRERCASCHRPPKNEKQVKKHGDRVSWIVPGDPAATMDLLIDHKLVNRKNPLKSLILAKPTLQKKHEGGLKLVPGDETYERWLTWIEDWAQTVSDGYKQERDLPVQTEVSLLSDNFIRITSPKSIKGTAIRLDIHAWDDAVGSWEALRCAATTRVGGPKGAMARLYLYLVPGSERHRIALSKKSLPPGKFQARIYLDKRFKKKKGRLPRFRKKPDHTLDLDLTWKTGMNNRNVIAIR